MSLFDTILLIILASFTLMGFWGGFIRTLGGIIGVFIGVFFASRYYEQGAHYVQGIVYAPFAKFASFAAIALVVTKLTGIVFWFLDKVFKIVAIIPFVKTFNRLLGAALGFLQGAIIIGVILSFIGKLALFPELAKAISTSTLTPPLLALAQIALPLFPEALQKLKVLF